MEIWEKDGITAHSFVPPYTYFSENDKYISSPIGVQEGIKNGKNYYLSFPSFSYLLPYFLFQSLHVEITALNLQLYNLFLHLILILFLYKLLLLLFHNKNAALLGSTLYLFAPGPLWFHGNAYTHHVLSALFFVLTVYFIIKIYQDDKRNILDNVFLVVSSTCLLYTEWIGFLLVFTLGVIVAIKKLKNRRLNNLLALTLISTGIVSSILYFQYSSFIGWENYISYLTNRFDVRSSLNNDTTSIFTQLLNLFKWYIVSYGVWIAFILSILLFQIKEIRVITTFSKRLDVILLFILPVILYHIIFMGFTLSHDYSVLIDGVPLCLLCAFLASKSTFVNTHVPKITFVLITFSIVQYYFINRPGEFNQNDDRYDTYMTIGNSIKKNAQSDETVFIIGTNYAIPSTNPQIMFYAKRNFVSIKEKSEAVTFLKKQKKYKGIIFYLEDANIESIERIEI